MKKAISRHAPAAPDVVWDALADFGAIGHWASAVDHAEITSVTRADVGMTRRIAAGRAVVLEAVTTWDPPTTLKYRFVGLPPFVGDCTNEWTVTPAADGGAEVTLTLDIVRGGPPPTEIPVRALGTRLAKVNLSLLDDLLAHLVASPENSASENRGANLS